FANSVRFAVVTLAGSSDSENVSTIGVFTPTSISPSLGLTDSSCGAVTSPAAPVVKLKLKPLELPARSVTPLVWTLIVFAPGNGLSGVNVTTLPLTVNVPAMSLPDVPTWIDVASVVTSMGSLYVSVTAVVTVTFVECGPGTIVTVGAAVSGVALL